MIGVLKRRRMRLAILHSMLGAAGTAWQFYTPGGVVWLPAGVFVVATVVGVREAMNTRRGPRDADE